MILREYFRIELNYENEWMKNKIVNKTDKYINNYGVNYFYYKGYLNSSKQIKDIDILLIFHLVNF